MEKKKEDNELIMRNDTNNNFPTLFHNTSVTTKHCKPWKPNISVVIGLMKMVNKGKGMGNATPRGNEDGEDEHIEGRTNVHID